MKHPHLICTLPSIFIIKKFRTVIIGIALAMSVAAAPSVQAALVTFTFDTSSSFDNFGSGSFTLDDTVFDLSGRGEALVASPFWDFTWTGDRGLNPRHLNVTLNKNTEEGFRYNGTGSTFVAVWIPGLNGLTLLDTAQIVQFDLGDHPELITFSNFQQVSSVPLPAAVWFMGSGLLALLGFGRRNKANQQYINTANA